MSKKGIGCIVSAVIVTVLLFVLLPGIGPMRWIIQMFYQNPIAMITLVAGITLLIIFGVDFEYFEENNKVLVLIGTLSTIFSILWFIFSHAFMMNALYLQTKYEEVAEPFAITEFRNSSFMEAKENFKDQNPDARYSFRDLDYIRGNWISDFSPNAGITPLTEKTAGFFEYHPGEKDPVVIKRQKMPYAEGGWLFNSETFFIYNKEPFAKFTEILYIEDQDNPNEYIGVVSLIYRKGIFRVPYVGKVMLIYGNGEYELLSPRQAEKDERLTDIQIMPEWLAEKRALAYGWREGAFTALFTKRGRLSVQTSQINKENGPPYHLETEEGMMWYTPVAPRNKESLKGMLIEKSGEIGGTVYVWMLPGDQAWRGVDPLATTIKGIERSQSINWLRVSGEVRSGDTDIIELLPCPRTEGEQVVLYMCGYVSTDPPKSTRFYTIIKVETQEVFKDLKTIDEVNQWLRGEIEIPLHGKSSINNVTNVEEVIICGNPQELPNEQLLQCIILYAQELENRNK